MWTVPPLCINSFWMKLSLAGRRLVVTDSLKWRTWWWWEENLTPCVSSPTSSLSITTCASLSEPSFIMFETLCPEPNGQKCYTAPCWTGCDSTSASVKDEKWEDEEGCLCDMLSFNMPHVLWLCFYQERPRKPIYFVYLLVIFQYKERGWRYNASMYSYTRQRIWRNWTWQCNDARLQRQTQR